jgi:septum formation inhibitor MinC
LDVAGHALPIPTLASGKAASSAVVAIPTATAKSAVQTNQGAKPVQIPKRENIPLPGEVAIPLPSLESNVPAPVIESEDESEAEQVPVNTDNLKEVVKATQDAFAGAFNIGVEEETAPVVEEEIIPVVVAQEVVEEIQPAVVQVEQSIVAEVEEDKPQQDKFVSAAEHFIAADTDGSGQLSIEELAEATDTTIEEATVLHAQADTDGDGAVSLSEFMSSAAGEKAAVLPKPVAPVRKPLSDNGQPKQETRTIPQPRPIQSNQQQQQQQQQNWNQQQPQPQQQQQNWNQQPQPQPQQQPQQGWNQPQTAIQPTIRSGVLCRGCGIGLDPNWRHCPICGSPNTGY